MKAENNCRNAIVKSEEEKKERKDVFELGHGGLFGSSCKNTEQNNRGIK